MTPTDRRVPFPVDDHERGTIGATYAVAPVIHRHCYAASEAVYMSEVDPLSKADVVIDNRDFAAPRIVRN